MKKIQAAPISKISFYKSEVKDKLKGSIRKRKTYTSATEIQQKQFIAELAKDETSKPVGLSLFKETYSLFSFTETVPVKHLPVSMQTLYSEKNKNLTAQELDAKCENVKQTMKVTQAEVDYLAESTIKQSSSPVWHEQRTGRVTASVAHNVLHTKPDNPALSIIKKICHPNSAPINTPAISWGREKESEAIKAYTDTITAMHSDCTVTRTGMKICVDKPFIGASPDAIISCKCHGTGVVEVKCPYTFRDTSVLDMLTNKECCLTDSYALKPSHPYFTQVQQQMLVFHCEYCHFVLWTNQGCVITCVPRDNNFIDNLVSKVENFWVKNCLPELLTRRMLDSPIVGQGDTSKDISSHCICGQPDNLSDMIGCDGVDCNYKWFHFTCVKIKRAPKGAWYCKYCRKQKSN